MLIHGSCHCGNIGFALRWEPDPVEIPARACTCSFCVKHGGVWTSYPAGALRVTVADPAHEAIYEHGTRTAQFHVCTRCGAVPVVTSRIDDQLHAVVSVNAFDGVDPALIRRGSANLEGEDVESRLARRTRSWIGRVEIVRGAG